MFNALTAEYHVVTRARGVSFAIQSLSAIDKETCAAAHPCETTAAKTTKPRSTAEAV
jgi:hypothetical protein